jgi:hypothetical protein
MKVIIDGIEYVPAIDLPADANVYDRALNAPMLFCDEFQNVTVQSYLAALISKLLAEKWDFNAKRPFGSGFWFLGLIYSLIVCGYIPGKVYQDNDGDIQSAYSDIEADRLILELIQYVFHRSASNSESIE